MPFVAVLFLVFALFMAARVPRGAKATWLGLSLATFGGSILGLVGLITRFGNYWLEGMIVLPLDKPTWLWSILDRFPLDAFMRFRLWTLVGFVFSVTGFSLSYTTERWRKRDLAFAAALFAPLLFLLWYYDPQHLFAMYRAGAHLLNLPAARASWRAGLLLADRISLGLVAAVLTAALARILLLWTRTTIPQKRAQALCVGLGQALLAIFFLFLCCLGPARVMNAQAAATALLPVEGYPVFDVTLLLAVPFAGLVVMGAVILSILRFGFLGTWHMGTRELDRQITVANRAVRLALHSFKNRFLAVQKALELIDLELRGAEQGTASARRHVDGAREICRDALAQLDILHVQAGRLQISPTPLTLAEIWEEALERCEGRRREAQIVVRVREEGVAVWGDRFHLTAVLENLLQNAFDALAEAGGREPAIRVELGREYEWGFIRIVDNGPGIPRAHLRKVFRPFFTTKPAKNNWGMGLAYCHRVLKAHGGFINLRTKPGEGTMVEIVLRRETDGSSAALAKGVWHGRGVGFGR